MYLISKWLSAFSRRIGKPFDRNCAAVCYKWINKLQRIQNMAARVITFTPRRDHITPVLKRYTGCQLNTASSIKYFSMSEWDGSPISGKPAKETESRTHAFIWTTFARHSAYESGQFWWPVFSCSGTSPMERIAHWYQVLRNFVGFQKGIKTHIFKAYNCWHYQDSMIV